VRSNSKPLLRHHEDIRCIVTTGLFFTVFVVTWLNFASPFAGGLLSFTLWLALFQLSFMGAVTTHNAIHLPVFWGKNWNKFYQVCLSLQYGGAVSIFVPGHNLSHHKYPQQAKDVSKSNILIPSRPIHFPLLSLVDAGLRPCTQCTSSTANLPPSVRTTKVRYSWNLLNGLLFFWHVVLSGNKDDKLYFAAQARLNRPIVKQRQLEEIAVWGTTAVLILIDWRRWIWFALLPQFYAKYCILSLNFLQHDGCDMSSKYNFARNFTGKTLNYLCFNNGYHTVHHLHSGLHWSVLPQKHDELIGPQIAPSLESSNILLYMWRTFIYPGLRLDYKGNRLIITKEEYEMPDEPWFYNEAETFSNTKEYLAKGME
jgi:fatty acid desaturase